MKHPTFFLRSTLVAAMILLCNLCAGAFTVNNLIFTASTAGKCRLEGLASSWTGTTLTIPDEVTYNSTTYQVTSIDILGISTSVGLTGNGHSTVTKVVMGANLEFVGDRAFSYWTKLTTVDFSNCKALKTIGTQAFYGCPITSLTLPDNLPLDGIAPLAFVYSGNSTGYIKSLYIGTTPTTDTGCPNPTAIFGDAITSLEYTKTGSTVRGHWGTMPHLQTVKIASGATIADRAFEGCTTLKSASMKGVKEIGASAFEGCSSLSSINTSGTVGSSGIVFNAHCFANTALNIATYTLSNCVIGEGAFENTNIAAFDLSSVPVSAKAFNGCKSLKSISISGWESTLYEDAFFGVGPDVTVSISYYDAAHTGAFNGCAADVTIGTLKYCNSQAFLGFTGNLTIKTFDNTNDYTYDSPLYQSGVKNVTINSASTLRQFIFRDCPNLESITVKGGKCEELPSHFAYYCPNLREVSAPTMAAFNTQCIVECPNLRSFATLPTLAIQRGALVGCPLLESINGETTGCHVINDKVRLFYKHDGAIVVNASTIDGSANAMYIPELLDLRECTSGVAFDGALARQPMARAILIKAGTEALFGNFIGSGSLVITEGGVETSYGDADHDGNVSIADVNMVIAELLSPEPATGSASATLATSSVEMPWVQLWPAGPKFAKYNVGVDYTTSYEIMGGRTYAWGKTDTADTQDSASTSRLTGNADTATALWGDEWRMPTAEEMQALIDHCDIEWTNSDSEFGKSGIYVKGRTGKWAKNKIFLPLADSFMGRYWTADPSADGASIRSLIFMNGTAAPQMQDLQRNAGMFSLIRPVLK